MKWFLNTSYDGMPFVTFFEIKRLRTKKKKNKASVSYEKIAHSVIQCDALLLGTFSKLRRRRQRKRGETKDLMSRTMSVHVRFKTLYNS